MSQLPIRVIAGLKSSQKYIFNPEKGVHELVGGPKHWNFHAFYDMIFGNINYTFVECKDFAIDGFQKLINNQGDLILDTQSYAVMPTSGIIEPFYQTTQEGLTIVTPYNCSKSKLKEDVTSSNIMETFSLINYQVWLLFFIVYLMLHFIIKWHFRINKENSPGPQNSVNYVIGSFLVGQPQMKEFNDVSKVIGTILALVSFFYVICYFLGVMKTDALVGKEPYVYKYISQLVDDLEKNHGKPDIYVNSNDITLLLSRGGNNSVRSKLYRYKDKFGKVNGSEFYDNVIMQLSNKKYNFEYTILGTADSAEGLKRWVCIPLAYDYGKKTPDQCFYQLEDKSMEFWTTKGILMTNTFKYHESYEAFKSRFHDLSAYGLYQKAKDHIFLLDISRAESRERLDNCISTSTLPIMYEPESNALPLSIYEIFFYCLCSFYIAAAIAFCYEIYRSKVNTNTISPGIEDNSITDEPEEGYIFKITGPRINYNNEVTYYKSTTRAYSA